MHISNGLSILSEGHNTTFPNTTEIQNGTIDIINNLFNTPKHFAVSIVIAGLIILGIFYLYGKHNKSNR